MPRLREIPAYARLPLPVAAAEGCELILRDGRRVLDLYGGHCVNTLGYGDAALGRRLAAQWQELSFVTNALDHAPRAEFLQAFEANLPAGGWQLFCSNSGAEANENALKIALAVTHRSAVAAFAGAFHGRSAAAAAVTDGKAAAYPQAPLRVIRLPWGESGCLPDFVDGSVAAVIVEPIQSLAGVRVPPPGFLEALRAACDAAGALLLFDEVQTGNGRTGSFWAAQHYGVTPDLFTTAKGAAGGLPIGLTVVREEVAARMDPKLLGSTFGGGPLVLAAAAEVARRLSQPGFLGNVAATSAALQRAASGGPVAELRGAGLLLGLVLEPGLTAAAAQAALLEHGVLTGTSNDPQVLRLTPPLVLQPQQAQRLAEALEQLEVPA